MVKKKRARSSKKTAKATSVRRAHSVANANFEGVDFETVLGAFAGTKQQTIARDEIYHRLEWYFNVRHDPTSPHQIDPATPIELFFENMAPATVRYVLHTNFNRNSGNYVPAWRSALFHGVQIPWASQPPVAVGVRDVRTFSDLITCVALAYTHVGWNVT
jgi:hypothetical protein